MPGATEAPSLGFSPSPERGKARPGTHPRPGTSAMPEENAGRVSPAPFEGGKAGDRGRGKLGERSPGPGAAGGQPGAVKATPLSSFQGAPQQPEHGRAPVRRPGQEPGAGQGGSEQNLPKAPEQRQRFGTPPPMAAGEQGQRSGGGQPSGFHQPVTPPPAAVGGAVDEGRGQRARIQGAQGQPQPQQQGAREQRWETMSKNLEAQDKLGSGGPRGPQGGQGALAQPPPPPQRGGAPAGAERGQGQGQQEGGKRKQPKETPPPGPR